MKIQAGDLVRVLVQKPDRYSDKAYLVKWTSQMNRLAKLVGREDNEVFYFGNLKVLQ